MIITKLRILPRCVWALAGLCALAVLFVSILVGDANASVDDYWCYKCPPAYDLSGEYCLPVSGEGSTAKPVWVRPYWAKVAWSKPSSCPSFVYTSAEGTFCGQCPTSYAWLSSTNDPEFCARCDPGFTLIKTGSSGGTGGDDAASFGGAWSCPGRGILTITQTGRRVSGSYPWSGGGAISGLVSGSTMTATWRGRGGGSGQWIMTLSEDGARIDGVWNHATGGGGRWGCSRQGSGGGVTSETCEWRPGTTVYAGGCVCTNAKGMTYVAPHARCGH